MPGGDLTNHVKKYTGADQLSLVGIPPVLFGPMLTQPDI